MFAKIPRSPRLIPPAPAGGGVPDDRRWRIRRPSSRNALLLAAATPALAMAAGVSQALPVTYVSAAVPGSSVCGTFASPCRDFQNAIDQTDAGGTIVVLTSGDYSGGYINKSLTVTATGVDVVIKYCTNVGAFGVLLDPGEQVTLSGLNMDCRASGTPGLYFGPAGSLHVRDSLIQGYYGISVPAESVGDLHVADTTIANSGHVGPQAPALLLAGRASVTLDRVQFAGNNNGIRMQGGGSLVVRDSVISGLTGTGISVTRGRALVEGTSVTGGEVGIHAAGRNAVVRISGATITGNATGLVAEGGGRIISYENNIVRGNSQDGTPTSVAAFR